MVLQPVRDYVSSAVGIGRAPRHMMGIGVSTNYERGGKEGYKSIESSAESGVVCVWRKV